MVTGTGTGTWWLSERSAVLTVPQPDPCSFGHVWGNWQPFCPLLSYPAPPLLPGTPGVWDLYAMSYNLSSLGLSSPYWFRVLPPRFQSGCVGAAEGEIFAKIMNVFFSWQGKRVFDFTFCIRTRQQIDTFVKVMCFHSVFIPCPIQKLCLATYLDQRHTIVRISDWIFFKKYVWRGELVELSWGTRAIQLESCCQFQMV